MNQTIGEGSHWRQVIHVHEHRMRWIVIQSEVFARECLKHSSPHRRTDRQILSAGPFVVGEKHGAIFDADSNVGLLGRFDDGAPNVFKTGPVVVDRFLRIAANERGHAADSQLRGRPDQSDQVFCCYL